MNDKNDTFELVHAMDRSLFRFALSAVGLFGLFSLLVISCIPAQPDRSQRIEVAHSALNILTDAVDPAYEAARIGCKAADDAAITLAKADRITLAQLDTQVRESRERCDRTFDVFDRLRELQVVARSALDRAAADEGALQQAEAAIRDIRALWRP